MTSRPFRGHSFGLRQVSPVGVTVASRSPPDFPMSGSRMCSLSCSMNGSADRLSSES